MIKALFGKPIPRPVALLGVIGGLSMVIGGVTTLIPDSGAGGVMVTLLALLTTLYYAYQLVRWGNTHGKRDDSAGG
jgi:hypothetical protein